MISCDASARWMCRDCESEWAPAAGRDAIDWVLGTFKSEEQVEVAIALDRAIDAIDLWAREGIAAAMNRFNANPS